MAESLSSVESSLKSNVYIASITQTRLRISAEREKEDEKGKKKERKRKDDTM
jgi:hypothetical protein